MSIKRLARAAAVSLIGEKTVRTVSTAARDGRGEVSYRVMRAARRSASQLAALEHAHAGQRCFVIGNGPSLNLLDLSRLNNEITFGLNRGYLLANRLGATPTYLVSVNKYVIEQFGDDIVASESVKFLSWAARLAVGERDDVIYVRTRVRPDFYFDIPKTGVWEGATVTYVALQIAFFLGFSEVILIGVDHSFSTSGPPNALVVSRSPDPNHFDPNYFGPGARWQLPDLATSEVAYAMAKDAYEHAGRRVINATAGGELNVFERVPYDVLLRSGPVRGSSA